MTLNTAAAVYWKAFFLIMVFMGYCVSAMVAAKDRLGDSAGMAT